MQVIHVPEWAADNEPRRSLISSLVGSSMSRPLSSNLSHIIGHQRVHNVDAENTQYLDQLLLGAGCPSPSHDSYTLAVYRRYTVPLG